MLVRYGEATGNTAYTAEYRQFLLEIQNQVEAANLREQLESLGYSAEQVSEALEGLATVQAAEAQARERNQAAAGIQPATSAISSLQSYAQSLRVSEYSPLSSTERYMRASADFYDIASRASTGDSAAIRELQRASDAFLAQSRQVYGSGAQSVRDYETVVAALAAVSALSEDTLTASFYAETQETQTDRLVAELRSLREEVAQLRNQPARVT